MSDISVNKVSFKESPRSSMFTKLILLPRSLEIILEILSQGLSWAPQLKLTPLARA
jgi:hypothetical protein